MGETIFTWIWKLANVPFAGRWLLLVLFGLRALARCALGYFYGITMAAGIEFYSSRVVLNKHRELADIVKNTKTGIFVFSVRGDSVINSVPTPENYIKKFLLPNPASDSFVNFEQSVKNSGLFASSVKSVTKKAQEKEIPVRWYPEFVGYSLLIGDRNEDNAWVHLEFVLPCTYHLDRPSLTIRKKQQPIAFEHFARAFDEMWDKGEEPDDSTY